MKATDLRKLNDEYHESQKPEREKAREEAKRIEELRNKRFKKFMVLLKEALKVYAPERASKGQKECDLLTYPKLVKEFDDEIIYKSNFMSIYELEFRDFIKKCYKDGFTVSQDSTMHTSNDPDMFGYESFNAYFIVRW